MIQGGRPGRTRAVRERRGTATLTYRTSGSLFGPYQNAELDEMAKELDGIIGRIARDAAGG